MRLLLTLISLPVFLSFSPASAQSLPGNIYWTPLSDNNDAHYIVTWFPNIEPSLQLWPPTQMTIAFMGVENFFWQGGYGAFSVGESQRPALIRYIAEQEEHHRHLSFQEEFRRLLDRYRVLCDERYAWD